MDDHENHSSASDSDSGGASRARVRAGADPVEGAPAPGTLVRRGREALTRGDWETARELFEEEVSVRPGPEAWEGLATAAAWQQDAARAIEARERAHQLYRARNDVRGAARTAIWLANDYADFRGDGAVANGWLARARRLLEGSEPSSELGLLHCFEGHFALMGQNDPTAARARAEEALRVARAAGDPEAEMLARAVEGLAQVTGGEVSAGMTCLDEAVVAATGGDVSDHNLIASACCYMIHACERVRDFRRAGEWCRRLHDFSTRWRVGFYLTICRLQYSTVLLWRGDWAAAEAELNAAVRELTDTRPTALGAAHVRLGELRRRQGRWEEAAKLYDRSRGHRLSQLGRAALALDGGNPGDARDVIEAMLQRLAAESRTERAAGLELLVQARAALGDAAGAREALTELRATVEQVGTLPLLAAASFAGGTLAMAGGDFEAARVELEDAAERFEQAGLPFEAGRARSDLSRALLKLGRPSLAVEEARIARNVLEAIGAEREAARARDVLDAASAATQGGSLSEEDSAIRATDDARTEPRASGQASRPLTKRQRQVLRLVAEGMSDREIGKRLFISEYTVHRHMANILARLGTPSRTAAVMHALRGGLL